MKAVIFEQYGGPEVLQYTDINKPTPKANDVLIKVAATALNAYDWHIMRADPFLARLAMGLFKPNLNILGIDFAGTVEEVGGEITDFKIGDEVFGDISGTGKGALAEYVCAKASLIAIKSPELSFAEAAAIPMAAVTALQGLRDAGKLQTGQKVLINGAAGGVGTFAIQIAKAMRAEVTAVCSARNGATAKALGADYVIDYRQENFTENDKRYDLILGVNGYQSLDEYKRVLTPNGTYVMVGGTNKQIFDVLLKGAWASRNTDKKIVSLSAKPNRDDLNEINKLVATGKLKPIIDRHYPLQDTAKAITYLEEGHAQGKIIIDIMAN